MKWQPVGQTFLSASKDLVVEEDRADRNVCPTGLCWFYEGPSERITTLGRFSKLNYRMSPANSNRKVVGWLRLALIHSVCPSQAYCLRSTVWSPSFTLASVFGAPFNSNTGLTQRVDGLIVIATFLFSTTSRIARRSARRTLNPAEPLGVPTSAPAQNSVPNAAVPRRRHRSFQ